MFLKTSQVSQESLFNKLTVLRAATLLKTTPTQVLSCQICQILKNNHFEENLWPTASKFISKQAPTQVFSCEFCKLFKNTYYKDHLRTTGSKTPLWGFLFNKVVSLMAWRPLKVLERDSGTIIFLWILCNFEESVFVEYLETTPSFIQIGEVSSLKSICLVKLWLIRRGNSQAHLILCSYGSQAETSWWSCGHTCTNLSIPIAGEVEEKEKLRNLLKSGKWYIVKFSHI